MFSETVANSHASVFRVCLFNLAEVKKMGHEKSTIFATKIYIVKSETAFLRKIQKISLVQMHKNRRASRILVWLK